MIGFINSSVTCSLKATYYSAIADLHAFLSTVAHALGFSVLTSRLLGTVLNTETSASHHYEVLLPFLVQSLWNLCTNLRYNRSSLYKFRKDNIENTSHVISSQRVHWRFACYLATNYNTRPLKHIFHCCT
jgi:hypothetical protein